MPVRGLDPGSHRRERVGDPAHRPRGERLVAAELELLPGLPGEDAGDQADERAGVAAVDRTLGRLEAAQADAVDAERVPPVFVDADAERPNGADGRLGVLRAPEAPDDGLPLADRPDQQRAMRHRLVTGQRHRPAEADGRRDEHQVIAL